MNHGTATLTNVTISGNSASFSGSGIEQVGHITLINVTLSGNSGGVGESISFADPSIYNVATTMRNTLLAEAGGGGNCYSAEPFAITGDHNLSDDNTCGFGDTGHGADNVTNLLLGPLANNGGLTMTHLPQAGSAAIDAGNSNGAPSTDQRGVPRPRFAGVDVGAVEYQPLIDSTRANISYDGWAGVSDRFANGGYYRISNTANDVTTYGFSGTSIKWIARKGPEMNRLRHDRWSEQGELRSL